VKNFPSMTGGSSVIAEVCFRVCGEAMGHAEQLSSRRATNL
jgi:hypothetical protein